jgi:RecA-family ATPase
MQEKEASSQGEQPKKPRKKGLEELRTEALKGVNEEMKAPVAKTVFSYAELYEQKEDQTKFIIPELLPAHSVAMFIGEDGIGKTQLCTQLALHICFKYPSFLGLPLNAVHHSALICATEDSRKKWIQAAAKQHNKLEPNVKPTSINLQFMEASEFDELQELKDSLEGELKRQPYDLIVVDAFSDLFTMIDGEINSNKDARTLLKYLGGVCSTYSTTIIVIHHAAKTKIVAKRHNSKIFVEKNDSQGAGAITQRPRTVLALSNDPKSISENGLTYTNYLHAVKANEMGKHYVKHAIRLQFDGGNLLHKNTGLVDIDMYEDAAPAESNATGFNNRKATPAEIPAKQHQEVIAGVLRPGEEMPRKDFVQKLAASYGVGTTKIESANGFIAYLLENGYIIKTGAGMYKKKPAYVAPQSIIKLEDDEEAF